MKPSLKLQDRSERVCAFVTRHGGQVSRAMLAARLGPAYRATADAMVQRGQLTLERSGRGWAFKLFSNLV